jgi:hypothetical protein
MPYTLPRYVNVQLDATDEYAVLDLTNDTYVNTSANWRSTRSAIKALNSSCERVDLSGRLAAEVV